ncbi:helicase associated domain-containing protein [Embleya sp. NPDC005971]|uniref:helicase associated domain-containing protein n=1 Tax=Embleya sp. NPDC005971 TaxID=3156724 RepID=UPI0033D3601F
MINPERRDWRRSYPAARRWHGEHGDLKVPLEAIDYDIATGTSHPVGAWLSEQRKAWSVGAISRRRIRMLAALGMVWNAEDAAFEDGLAMCRAYFAVHGHLAAPKSAAVDNHPVGQFLANCRRPLESRRNPGRWRERWARLAEIDADWNPAGRADPARWWSLEWQRMLAVVRLHVEGGGSLEALVPGCTAGGEDVGAWLERQRRGGADLTPAQRKALAGVGVDVTAVVVPEQRAVVDRWVLTPAAAAAFREREGHLVVPRRHVEQVGVDGVVHAVKLGVALANARQRRATWPAERVEALTVLGCGGPDPSRAELGDAGRCRRARPASCSWWCSPASGRVPCSCSDQGTGAPSPDVPGNRDTGASRTGSGRGPASPVVVEPSVTAPAGWNGVRVEDPIPVCAVRGCIQGVWPGVSSGVGGPI